MDTDSLKSSRKITADPKGELSDAAKNWLAMDGLWFQAVEVVYGIEAALEADRRVWEQFSVIEAHRILERLELPDQGGLDALAQALEHRLYFFLNEQDIQRPDPATLILTMKTCRVQAARERRKMPLFPCKSVGLIEYSVFARTIDNRIETRCISCPPETIPGIPFCSWEFTIPVNPTGQIRNRQNKMSPMS
jgi:hypothetical protein